jgi:hypothetical protein
VAAQESFRYLFAGIAVADLAAEGNEVGLAEIPG